MNEWMNGRVAWSRFPEAAAHLVRCTMPYHFVPYHTREVLFFVVVLIKPRWGMAFYQRWRGIVLGSG